MNTIARYPRQSSVDRYLSGIGQDAETFSQRRLAETQDQIAVLESNIEFFETEIKSIEDHAVYKVFYSDQSERDSWIKWKVTKTTDSYVWLEPRYGGRLFRLPKQPLLNGEVVEVRRGRFAIGTTVRNMISEMASDTSDILDDYYLELHGIQTDIANGRVPLPDHIHYLLLDVEDYFLPQGENIPATVDWKKFGF